MASGIRLSNANHLNLGLTEDVIIQLIASRQLAVYRAIVETWKNIALIQKTKSSIFLDSIQAFKGMIIAAGLGFTMRFPI